MQQLETELLGAGTEVTTVQVPPLSDDVTEQLDAYEYCSSLELGDFDLVIAASAPGWLVRHDRLVVMSSGDGLVASPEESTVAEDLDRLEACESPSDLIRASRTMLAAGDASHPVAAPAHMQKWLASRLEHLLFSGSSVKRLITPSEFSARRFETLGWGEPIMVAPPAAAALLGLDHTPARNICFTESRFDGDDRLPTVIEAFATIDDVHAELRVAGDGPNRPSIEAATHDRRIRFLGAIDDTTRSNELEAACSTVLVATQLGWSHLGAESMLAGTPLVAPVDAGGIVEIVEHGVNGVLIEPTTERLSWGIRHVAGDPRLRWQMGLQAKRAAAQLTWASVLDELADLASPADRPRFLAVSTYPFDPMVGGGQRRARYLSRGLTLQCDVTVLVNRSPGDRVRRRLIEPGLTQIEVPKSEAQLAAELDMYHAMGRIPIDDLTAAELSRATPAFGAELASQLVDCDAIIATQTFLLPCVPPTEIPIVHDSHNVESLLKAGLLPETPAGHWLLERAVAAEAEAGRRAAVVTACTERDLELLSAGAPSPTPTSVVVSNGVDAEALPRKTEEEHRRSRSELLALAGCATDDQRPIGVFIGSWHPPNIEAARLVLELARQRSDWLFVLAGSHTSEFAGESIPDNVQLIAVFAEPLLWPLLAGADVALNPMLSGGGTNLKLFDYLAVGTPIVTTTIGARGLPDASRYATIADPDVTSFSDAIDRARQPSPERAASLVAGRRLIEETFDWGILGDQWADGILTALELTPGPTRQRTSRRWRPTLSSTTPPSTNPVIATMQILGQRAMTTPPSPQEVSMDPALRERLKQANENRNIGRSLPDGARFSGPKRALIRVGHAFTNEQVIYNKAIVEAVEQLAVSLRAIEAEQRELRQTVETLTAENRSLHRRLEVLE